MMGEGWLMFYKVLGQATLHHILYIGYWGGGDSPPQSMFKVSEGGTLSYIVLQKVLEGTILPT